MENRVKELESAFCDVRKAHRLIYEYQERMLALIQMIRHKLDMPSMNGYKHFSDPINGRKGKYQVVFDGMWAWDFQYSYIFEYFLGDVQPEKGGYYYLGVIQYTDTGFFENDNEDRCDVSKFAPEEKSGSKLLFFMEYVPNKCKEVWEKVDYTEQYVYNKEYASMKHTSTILYPKGKGKNAIVLYSIPLSRFIDEKSTIAALQEYVDFLRKNKIVDITLA